MKQLETTGTRLESDQAQGIERSVRRMVWRWGGKRNLASLFNGLGSSAAFGVRRER